MCAKLLQSCLTLCDLKDYILLGSSVHGFSRHSMRIHENFQDSPPVDIPDPGIEPGFLMPPALAGGFLSTGPLGKSQMGTLNCGMWDLVP